MPLNADTLDKLLWHVGDTVKYSDLARRDWRRQTDIVREIFIATRMFVDLGNRATFVDARLSNVMIIRALEAVAAGQSLTGFFNARCHDAGFKSRRFFVFDTVTRNNMVVDRKGNSRARLHVHGLVERPEGWTDAELQRVLKRVFGNAVPMGKRQLHLEPLRISKDEIAQHYTVNGVQANGPLGKVFYDIAHAGSTYATLGLNEGGKRSRSAPWQGSVGRRGQRLARGVPSNFNRKVVFYDQESGRAGKDAFESWIAAHKARADRLARSAGPEHYAARPRRRTGTEG